MIHLSVRLVWHDTGWNGCVCQQPHLNASCIAHELIREQRDDVKERSNAGRPMCDLGEWRPPCSRDINAFSPVGFNFVHSDPLHRSFLAPTSEFVPPYTCLPAPYRWMREDNFRDICENEGLSIRVSDTAGRDRGWVYEPDRQEELLQHFWGRFDVGHSLVFFYVNHGNPVDEEATRLLLGAGRLASLGPQLYFNGQDERRRRYPIWTRTVTHAYPKEGFLLPYQQYIRKGVDPQAIACYVPSEAVGAFSYVAEHVSDDLAVGVVERLIQSVTRVQSDNLVVGSWIQYLDWLNDRLAELWRNRGPFPGIGAVLQYLGFRQGTAFHRLELKEFVRRDENPWSYVRAILEHRVEPPGKFSNSFSQARLKWRALQPAKRDLLDQLVRFELTYEQILRICTKELRSAARITATDEELIANPYLICESDIGGSSSAPVSLESIDRGMLPEGDGLLFSAESSRVAQDDPRRVRAVAVEVLRSTATQGDTLQTFSELLALIRKRFPARRVCQPDGDVMLAQTDFYGRRLWLDTLNDTQVVALHQLRSFESQIRDEIRGRVQRINQAPTGQIDWAALLRNEFGEPKTARAREAEAEKVSALETLVRQRVSVLIGGAGTGKTSTIKVFLEALEQAEGKRAVFLLAPTGKARVRLWTATNRKTFTIHQFLFRHKWYEPEVYELRESGGDRASAPTVVIDEASMISADLLATLFRAIDFSQVKRLVFVGDTNQLPPIGPGRPFVDIVSWLKRNHPQCVATLRTTMRTAESSPMGDGSSLALALADGYRTDDISPADDEILALVAHGGTAGDLEMWFWQNHDDLSQKLRERLQTLLSISSQRDYKGFNRSLGISDELSKQDNWKAVEAWQILSPVRNHAFGTEELNRALQLDYRQGLIQGGAAQRPFGEQRIVWKDKVIQIRNDRRYGWPSDTGIDYVANGEIGIVTNTGKNRETDYLQVGFSTQDHVTYRYKRGEVEENLEIAYALTVHKAQGSDFDVVFLVIPQEAATLSRELIYTGLTRFRKKLVLLVQKDTGVLEALRRPERSQTYLRNTFLFEPSLRPDAQLGAWFPETLIHRTSTGVPVRSKSEVIVADTLTRLNIDWQYEQRLSLPSDPTDFRLPDLTFGRFGDMYYWEHLGMLSVPTYRAAWERKRQWYEGRMRLPVVGPGGLEDVDPLTLLPPFVITSRDNDDGGIDSKAIEQLARKYVFLDA